MTMEDKIARINELYHKSQNEGLTKEEKEEQAKLRKEYIDSVKGSLKSQLDNVDIKEKDGSITNLGEQMRRNKENKTVDFISSKKQQLRKDFLAKRNLLSKDEIIAKSQLIEAKLINEEAYKKASVIMLYASYGSEVHTFGIMEKAIKDGKTVAFPKCQIVDGNPSLKFYTVDKLSQLTDGYKGILEPDTDKYELKSVEKADICIVPGCAFTRKGYRIGYGKGFYDRFISNNNSIKYIGLSFKQQLCHDVCNDKNDMPVDLVITEDSIYVCN